MPLPYPWSFMPWGHELFAGCSAPPFPYDFSVCDGACPRPCRSIVHNGSATETATFTYDDRGRWLSTTAPDGPTLMYTGACRYDGDVLAACGALAFRRDARGQLVGIIDGRKLDIKIAWSGDKVTRIDDGDKHFDYHHDTLGRLIAFDSNQFAAPTHVTWRYRDDGRLLDETNGDIHTTYTYDEHGRLTIVDKQMPDDPAYGQMYNRIELAYDLAGRLIRETTIDSPSPGSDAPSTMRRDYKYSCP